MEAVLIELLYQLADDELVIGHRDSEWLGLAPHFEEDIAFASIAQDEIGHAAIFYKLLEELGQGKADDLAFLRPAAERRNAVLLERPNGEGSYLENPQFDWGYTIARRLCYDLYDAVRLDVLTRSAYQPLAQVAAKIKREERYHLLHQTTWFQRLATATPESRQRLEEGLAKVWTDVGGLFRFGRVTAGRVFPAGPAELAQRWLAEVGPLFERADLTLPSLVLDVTPDGRMGEHTPELERLLETMGEVYRTAPGATW